MPRVKCFLPNASELINGIPFTRCETGGVESESITDDQAAQFVGIQGYVLIPDEPVKARKNPKTPTEE